MTRDELVRQIGEHVLSNFDEWMGNPKGRKIVIPNKIPRKRYAKEFKFLAPSFSDWTMTVECSAPPLVQMQVGMSDYKFLKPSEYFKQIGKLGWDK